MMQSESVKTCITRCLRELYIIALLIAVFALALSPIHSALTIRQNVLRTLPSGEIEFAVRDGTAPPVGNRIPAFRFNPSWEIPIGYVRVVRIENDIATAAQEPDSFRWPMGLQGTIVAVEGSQARINVGSDSGLFVGQELNLFVARRKVGQLKITEVTAREGSGKLNVSRHVNPLGAAAAPFIIPNQVAYCGARWFLHLEWALLILFATAYLAMKLYPQLRRSTVSHVGAAVRWVVQSRSPALCLLFGLPATFVLTKFLLYAFGQTATRILQSCGADQVASSVMKLPDNWLGLAVLEAFAGYCYLLLWKREAPFSWLRRRLNYRPFEYRTFPWNAIRRALPLDSRVVNWALHLLVVYAFSRTLLGFLSGNLAAMAENGWDGHNLRFESFREGLPSLGKLLTTTPTIANLDVALVTIRIALFNITILGCLLGYLHSTVSILWTRSIRNVDFTFTGWIVNAACYPLLLGGAVASMHGPLSGVDPGVADGPLYEVTRWGELLLNLLYTLSILNLGKRFGVMVDKGLRTDFMYAVVRHPSYTLEPFMFLLLFLPAMTDWTHYLAASSLPISYWVRSERDDDFMTASNPDYLSYKESVPDKFLPGIL